MGFFFPSQREAKERDPQQHSMTLCEQLVWLAATALVLSIVLSRRTTCFRVRGVEEPYAVVREHTSHCPPPRRTNGV